MEDRGFIKGSCMLMCPETEINMREREGLLHPLESLLSQENIQCQTEMRRKSFGKSPSKLQLRADINKVVKEYSRSAAGRLDLDPCTVRPAPVLKQTMVYLLHSVAALDSRDWSDTYDFVFDRIRAVRQDMTIQGIMGQDAILILEQIVRFHAYASYRLRKCDLSDFDPAINKHHLLECLKELLWLYKTTDGPHPNQPEFESVYLCDNLGHEAALSHCLSLDDQIRSDPLVLKCLETSLAVLTKNYAKALRLIHTVLCPTCLTVVSFHLDRLRMNYLQILCHGYSAKNCQFPLDVVTRLLYLPSDGTVTTDLVSSCHRLDWFNDPTHTQPSGGFVSFSKTKFVWPTETRPCPTIPVLDEMLNPAFLPNILVYGRKEGRRDDNSLNAFSTDGKMKEEKELAHSGNDVSNSLSDGINNTESLLQRFTQGNNDDERNSSEKWSEENTPNSFYSSERWREEKSNGGTERIGNLNNNYFDGSSGGRENERVDRYDHYWECDGEKGRRMRGEKERIVITPRGEKERNIHTPRGRGRGRGRVKNEEVEKVGKIGGNDGSYLEEKSQSKLYADEVRSGVYGKENEEGEDLSLRGEGGGDICNELAGRLGSALSLGDGEKVVVRTREDCGFYVDRVKVRESRKIEDGCDGIVYGVGEGGGRVSHEERRGEGRGVRGGCGELKKRKERGRGRGRGVKK